MTQRDVRSMSDDELFASWVEWITRTSEEISDVYHNRYVMRTIQMMFDENPKLHTESGGHVWGWIALLYARDCLMFIRREFDTQNNSINLLKLLGEISARPTILSRARFRKLYDKCTVPEGVKDEMSSHDFNRAGVVTGPDGPGSDYINPDVVKTDLAETKQQVEVLLEYANRVLAHRTGEWGQPEIRIPNDLDAPLEAIHGCFNKYYVLLTGKNLENPEPHVLFDWQDCFNYAWATNAYHERAERETRERRETEARGVLESIKTAAGSRTTEPAGTG